jgi:phospholipid/cholesterol/gamma-HCH transport system ATP-binding protein
MRSHGTIDVNPGDTTAPKTRTGDVLLRFEDVTVRYYDTVAVNQVSFELRAGETRVLLGEASSGKTVVLKTALGLQRPTSGRVTLFGQDITRMREQELFALRSRVGILFQEGGLFDSLTIEENVSYPLVNQIARRSKGDAGAIDEAVREALRFVELEHTLQQFPSELSGGMRRRVGIARAVVTEPELVLYDSPTAGLDPITANTIMALIVKERDMRNTAALMATHRYQDGQLMANFRYNPDSGQLQRVSVNGDGSIGSTTKFMVMREGRLVFEGSQPELESSPDSYLSKFVLKR